MIVPDPELMKGLPTTVPEIERWIVALGGRKVRPRERAVLKKHGLLGMPRE
jgi:hypothetical protein